ncbi:ketosteroid isomerase [Capsulimonas corticalis]|uniref:Ketosteroid isomerase n=1 Tax=Capsulimonas corticalis TaxID=2219043 RepID=A0A402CT58_9BACT|nr:nuclear transport factor 2 family protein [Capsulimonas corticalis]BDI30838.1 ketosteroid isomerase [Capsulimonas corticalis]
MSVKEVAQGLVDLCKEGKFEEAMSQYYSDDIVSTEPMGENPVSTGIAAVKAKGEWWVTNFEVHGVVVTGPFVNGDQFIVGFELDATNRPSGKRETMKEAGLYTVKDDKIVNEIFYY